MPRKKEEFDYESDIAIDEDDLFNEWLAHPNLAFKYGKALAKAKKEHSNAWEDLKVARSEIIKDYKEDNPKATGPMIEAHYRTHNYHIDAKSVLIEAEYKVNLLQTASDNFNYQRKEALKNLVKLRGQDYYSSEDKDFDKEATKQKIANRRKRR